MLGVCHTIIQSVGATRTIFVLLLGRSWKFQGLSAKKLLGVKVTIIMTQPNQFFSSLGCWHQAPDSARLCTYGNCQERDFVRSRVDSTQEGTQPMLLATNHPIIQTDAQGREVDGTGHTDFLGHPGRSGDVTTKTTK